jgi:hypothetical protein
MRIAVFFTKRRLGTRQMDASSDVINQIIPRKQSSEEIITVTHKGAQELGTALRLLGSFLVTYRNTEEENILV